MKKGIVIFITLMGSCFFIKAQVKIGDNPTTISPGSLLELESTSKALTLPRMTTVQMQAIASPVKGMILFNTDSNCIYLYKANNVWASIESNSISRPWPYNSNNLQVDTIGNAKGIISLTGTGLTASGDYSHAEGKNSVATGVYSWSIGNSDTATGTAAMAMGIQNNASGSSSFAAGFKNISNGQSSIALGQENYDSGWASLAAGHNNRIGSQVSYSNILGYNNKVYGGWSHTLLGESNIIKNGRANGVMGIANIADGNYNNLFGNANEVKGGNANLMSGEMNLIKSGNSSFLMGFNNLGEADYSAAFGKDNTVYFQSAVALGQGNKDSGWASVTGGLSNTIEKNVQFSASFGQNNLSTRNMSLLATLPGAATFSAGIGNINSGYGSIGLGGYTQARNLFSLAANYNTISNGYAMSAFGHYNDTIPSFPGASFSPDEILFSVGNGFNSSNRRNSFTMLRNGFTAINTTSNLGANLPRAELDVKGTGAIIVPVGTSAERPVTPVVGMIRYCTDCGGSGVSVLQGYNGVEWVNL